MSKSTSIFSKFIHLIEVNKNDYLQQKQAPKQQKKEGEDIYDSENDNGKKIDPVYKKKINKLYIVPSSKDKQVQNKKIIISKPDQKQKQIRLTQDKRDEIPSRSYTIFLRNLKESTTKSELEKIVNDSANIKGISIRGREGSITFSNKESADNAVDLLNNHPGQQMKAVINYDNKQKRITLFNSQSEQVEKNDTKPQEMQPTLMMDRKESIFDRITKQ